MAITRRELISATSKFLVLDRQLRGRAARRARLPGTAEQVRHQKPTGGACSSISTSASAAATACAPARTRTTSPRATSAPGSSATRSRTRHEQPEVDSPNGGIDGFPPPTAVDVKSFFVPKLCNHCADSPCMQVCPVGATFVSPDGVVLVDEKYCLGCRYCVQACPYGCRYLASGEGDGGQVHALLSPHHQGLTTACCENCPDRRAAAGGFQESRRTRFTSS